MAMSLKDQVEKARVAVMRAEDVVEAVKYKTRDTKYGKFEDNPQAAKDLVYAELRAASKKVKEAQKYYDNLLAALAKEEEKKAITGEEEGVSEEKQAALEGLTVEEYRASKQAALDKAESEKDAANQGVADEQAIASYSQFLNTIANDETQLKEIQSDLKKNFPTFYKGGTGGFKDWASTQSALESIYIDRGKLPKVLQGTDLRTFLIKPFEGFVKSGGDGTGAGGVYRTISDPTQAASLIKSAFKSVIGREPTAEEVTKYTKALNKAEKANPSRVVNGTTTGGIDRIEFLSQEIQKLPEFAQKKTEKLSLTGQSILGTARANGVTLNQAQIDSFAKRVQDGTDIKTIDSEIRNIAGLGMPEKVQKLLAQGIDLDTVYSPYRNLMASILELNPESIDLKDPTLRSAIGPDKEMPIYDFEKNLRKDFRWQYTDNAKRDVSNVALKVLRDFGFQA
jgi:hypothetical protein